MFWVGGDWKSDGWIDKQAPPTLRRLTPMLKKKRMERKAMEYTPARSSTSPCRMTTSSAERMK